jgi:hypothetical protein
LLLLSVREGLDAGEIAQVPGKRRETVHVALSRVRDAFEDAYTTLALLAQGTRACPELAGLVSGIELSPRLCAVDLLADACQSSECRLGASAISTLIAAWAPPQSTTAPGAGIETELKPVDARVYFASDAGGPETYGHFSADAEMLTFAPDSPFPLLDMKRFYARDPSTDWAQKSNSWSAPNFVKWSNDQYNALFDAAGTETDSTRAAQDWQGMNDLVVGTSVVAPMVDRKNADGKAKRIEGPRPGPFDVFSWNVADWTAGVGST